MAIHPAMTVKKASSALGMDKSIIRSLLAAGELQGELRRVGEKEKWFIYNSEVECILEKRLKLMERERTSLDGLTEFFDSNGQPEFMPVDLHPQKEVEAIQVDVPGDDAASAPERMHVTVDGHFQSFDDSQRLSDIMPAIDEIIQTLTAEFARRLADEHHTIYKLQEELEKREQAVPRLQDLEQRIRADQNLCESKDSDIRALKLHVTALEEELKRLRKPWWQKMFAQPESA